MAGGHQLFFVHTEGLTEEPPASAPCIPSGMLSIRLTAHHLPLLEEGFEPLFLNDVNR